MIKKWFKKLLLELVDADEDLNLKLKYNLGLVNVLSKEHPNLIYVDCYNMPAGKGREYMNRILDEINRICPGYKVILLRK